MNALTPTSDPFRVRSVESASVARTTYEITSQSSMLFPLVFYHFVPRLSNLCWLIYKHSYFSYDRPIDVLH